jgi:Domain of unknown function (DUF5666)
MQVYLSRILGSMTLLLLLAAFIAGCGPSGTSTSAVSVTATTTNCAQTRVRTTRATIGTLKQVNGTTLLITDTTGKTIQATYTNTTRFLRETVATTAALQEGAFVSVAVMQNPDNTYTATTISLINRTGQRPFQGLGQGQRRNAACPRPTQVAGNGVATGRGITGTVGQLSATMLTVTTFNGDDYTVLLTHTTQVVQTNQVSASVLQAGMPVSLFGSSNAQGVLTAQSVIILLSLPARTTP